MSTGPKETRHNVVFLGAKPVNLSFDGYQGASFHERTEKTDVVGIVACFRNEAVYGETIKPVRSARAHLKFFDSEGSEVGTGFSRALWLEEKLDLFDLIPGGGSGCVVVILASDQKITVPSKHRANTSWGEAIKDEFDDLEKLPRVCELSLLDSNNQLVLEPIRLELSGTKRELAVKTLPIPPARPVEAAKPTIVTKALADVSPRRPESANSALGTEATVKKPWTRDQKIALVLGILAAIAIVVAIATPEIRRKIGLEKAAPSTSTKPNAEEAIPATNSAEPMTQQSNKSATEKEPGPGNQRVPRPVRAQGNVSGKENSRGAIVNNAPGGIAISGGTVTNPTVNNYGPPPAIIRWSTVTRVSSEGAKFPRTYVELALDHSIESAKFAVVCDRPCDAVWHEPPPGASQVNYASIPNRPDVGVFEFIVPNPFPPDTKIVLGVQSKDDHAVKITQVTTVKIEK